MRGILGVITGLVALASAARTRVKVHPSQIRLLADTDWQAWTIADETSSTFTANGLDFLLSAGGDVALQGDRNKLIYEEFVPKLGERLLGSAITTNEDSSGGPITLTIAGLEAGEHSVLAWHNSWQSGDDLATLSVSVNGEEVESVRANMHIHAWYGDSQTAGGFSVQSRQQHLGCRHLIRDFHGLRF